MNKFFGLTVLLAVPLLSHAEDVRTQALKAMHGSLFTRQEICVVRARTALLPSSAEGLETVVLCTEKGKREVEEIYSDLERLLKGKEALSTLVTWRHKWIATFEATNLQPNDTKDSYSRRVSVAIKQANQAAQTLQLAVLKSPM